MRKLFFILTCFCFCGIVSGQSDSLCMISGYVYEKDSKIPLEKFLVSVNDEHACYTNKDGFYVLKDLPPGAYVLKVARTQDADRLVYRRFTGPTIILKPGKDTVVNIYLEPHRQLSLPMLPAPAMFSLGIHQGVWTTGEIAFGLYAEKTGKFFDKTVPSSLFSATLGTEFRFGDQRVLLGPKLCVNYYTLFNFLKIETDLIRYTDLSNGAWYLSPHAGLSLASFLDLDAGWNIKLGNNAVIPGVNRFHLSLKLNFYGI